MARVLQMMKSRVGRWVVWGVGVVLAALGGCASGPQAHPADPLEPFNRSMFTLNESVDKAVLKPVAQGYQAVVPQPIRAGVSNFYNNLEDGWTTINAVLQLRPGVAFDSLMRVGINTVVGFGGVIDLASEVGIARHKEDFGQTLGRWGVPAGPYLVFPLFGPSTLRDATTIVLENRYDPVANVDPIRVRNSLTGLRLVQTRASLLRLGNLLDEAALDKYSFIRDAFLQKRRAEIFRPGEESADPYQEPEQGEEQKP